MSILEYIETLRKAKESAEGQWDDLSSLNKEFLNESYEWLVDNLEIKSGRFVVESSLYEQMNKFVNAVMDIANNSKDMNGRVSKYLADIKVIETNLLEYHATENKLDIKKAGIKPIQEIFVDEMLDRYQGNGLNAHFAQPLKDLVYRNMLIGMNLKQARQYLTEYIMSGADKSGKLGRYLTQTAQQGVDSYAGMINKKLVENYTFDGYYISGSLIQTSSPQCEKAIDEAIGHKGFLTNKQWEAILTFAAKHGLIKGTNLQNLPINKLHWGCRHEFTPGFSV